MFGTISQILRIKRDIHNLVETLSNRSSQDYREIQGEQLKTLVKHAYENVDLYRKKYDETGVKPEDIKSVEDIRKLPTITKEDLRENFPQGILARNVDTKDCYTIGTSGSTGVPIKIFKDQESLYSAVLAFVAMPEILKSWGSKKDIKGLMNILVPSPDSIESVFLNEMLKVPRFLMRSFYSVNALTGPGDHLEALRKNRPNIVNTYPSVLRNMAIVCQEQGLSVPQPDFLLTSGEIMDNHTKKLISDTFEGDMINYYFASEAGLIAFECSRHEGLHIDPEVILELWQDEKPAPHGVPGTVVVTDLRNTATPMIRYAGLSDIAVLAEKECSCGIKLPLLKRVEGRVVDSLILPDKRVVHPFSLTLTLEHVPSVAKFQIVQEEIDKLRITIVEERRQPLGAISPFRKDGEYWNMIVQNFKELLGDDIHIMVDLVEDIPTSPPYFTVRSLVDKMNL